LRGQFALDWHALNRYKPATAAFLRTNGGDGSSREGDWNGFLNLFEVARPFSASATGNASHLKPFDGVLRSSLPWMCAY